MAKCMDKFLASVKMEASTYSSTKMAYDMESVFHMIYTAVGLGLISTTMVSA
jgi:hypothetical protein